jgi:outer membrane protein assembly factor BamB
VWGWSAHPVLDGNRLFCLVGGKDSVVIAFDKESGKDLWKALNAEEIGYAPPVVIKAGGKRQLIVWHTESVNALDPETGKPYWSQPYPTKGPPQRPAVNIATPRCAGDLLYVTSFYHGSLMLRLDSDKPAAKVLWKSKIENPSKADALNTVMMTPIIKDGHIYGVAGLGQLRCLKAETGEQQWETFAATCGKKVFLSTAFLVEQGDRFFIFNDLGDLLIARLTPKGYKEIDRAHVIEPTQDGRDRMVIWCQPAFANRCLFVRNDKELLCLSLAAGK